MDDARNVGPDGPGGWPEARSQPERRRARPPRRDALLRGSILAAFLAAAWLAEGSPGRATLFGVEGPECPSRLAFPDHGCPGCGLTRASAMALDGEIAASFELHPGGLALVLCAAVALLLHVHTLAFGQKSAWTLRLLRSGRVLLAGAILAGWIAR